MIVPLPWRLGWSLLRLTAPVGLDVVGAEPGAWQPRGPPVDYSLPPVPPVTPGGRACSLRLPLCVVAPSSSAASILHVAESTWDTMTGALRLPPPDPNPASSTFEIYALAGTPHGIAKLGGRDARSSFDRAWSFGVIDPNATGCALDMEMARLMARAVMLRVGPSIDEATARGQAMDLCHLVAPCAAGLTADTVAEFRAHPERAVTQGTSPGSSGIDGVAISRALPMYQDGSALFWAHLNTAYGRAPLGVVSAMWALAPTKTPHGASTWSPGPTGFDVLRATFLGEKPRELRFQDVLIEAAIARVLTDGDHDPTLAGGRTEDHPSTFDWDIPWPNVARRLAPRNPVAPTGSSSLRIAARPEGRLRVEIAWEEHALLRWIFVKLDASGRAMGRIPIPTLDRATEARISLSHLEGVAHVVLIGVNLGDPQEPFDSRYPVWEPHSWEVTLASE